MRFKKITVSFFGMLFALLVVPFSASAATLWSGQVHWNSSLGAYITQLDGVYATNYIQVCNKSSGGRWFYIKDYDPDSSDEKLSSSALYLSSGYCKTYYVNSLEDGTNGKAEIYLQMAEPTNYSNSYWSISQQ